MVGFVFNIDLCDGALCYKPYLFCLLE